MKKTKRILTAVLATSVAAVSCGSVFSASAASGKYIAYRYFFDTSANAKITAYNANISYNPNNVIYVENKTGNLGGNFNVTNIPVTTAQNIIYINYTNQSPSSQSGELGSITIKTLTNDVPTVNVTLVSGDNANATSVYEALLGDVNLDGRVNEDDANLLNKALAGVVTLNMQASRNADVNGNGAPDHNDSVNILQYVNGIHDSVLG